MLSRMETDPRRWIAVLRASQERLAELVASLDAVGLATASMCTDWSVAQVLSHLGSGAEIARSALSTGTGGASTTGDGGNEAVWARWNAMSPREMADSLVDADRALVEAFEALDDDQLHSARVDLGFLPEPIDIAGFAGMRLGEHALHTWDVTAAFDHDSEVADDATALLIDRLPVLIAIVSGFMPRETRPAEAATITVSTTAPERTFALELGDVAALRPVEPGTPTQGELAIPAGAFLRLTSGRLKPGWPGDDAAPTGGLTMAELHTAFPGY
jgi:uncharacterized protein (TIGR03083 family)